MMGRFVHTRSWARRFAGLEKDRPQVLQIGRGRTGLLFFAFVFLVAILFIFDGE